MLASIRAARFSRPVRLPAALRQACQRAGVPLTRHVLLISVAAQRAYWIERVFPGRPSAWTWRLAAWRGAAAGDRVRWSVFNPAGAGPRWTIHRGPVGETAGRPPALPGPETLTQGSACERRPLGTPGAEEGGLYTLRAVMRCSTSRLGVGQEQGSFRTPLGLHRIAAKIGGGWPVGTVFEGRQPTGYTWQGRPDAGIVHRLFWLEGLEDGFNRGGRVDSRARYIYVHGFGDETTLGRPVSRGCVHLGVDDLVPLYDRLPLGTLVWIGSQW